MWSFDAKDRKDGKEKKSLDAKVAKVAKDGKVSLWVIDDRGSGIVVGW